MTNLISVGVIYIGDRATGKTHLALELANPKHEYVKVNSLDYDELSSLLLDRKPDKNPLGEATSLTTHERHLDMNIQLPSGKKQVVVDCIDIGGEVWRKNWQRENCDQWHEFLKAIRDSEGILLILPPHRGMTFKPGVDAEEFPTQKQWCNRFDRWVTFFCDQCPKIRHLALCLNKADLFCDLSTEGQKLAYKPYNSPYNWQQRHEHVLRKYFRPVYAQIERLGQGMGSPSVKCFITSIYHRGLLELPWIYLGSFLGK